MVLTPGKVYLMVLAALFAAEYPAGTKAPPSISKLPEKIKGTMTDAEWAVRSKPYVIVDPDLVKDKPKLFAAGASVRFKVAEVTKTPAKKPVEVKSNTNNATPVEEEGTSIGGLIIGILGLFGLGFLIYKIWPKGDADKSGTNGAAPLA